MCVYIYIYTIIRLQYNVAHDYINSHLFTIITTPTVLWGPLKEQETEPNRPKPNRAV